MKNEALLTAALIFAAAVPAYAQVPKDAGQGLVTHLDTDKNGTVSEAEFTAPQIERAKAQFQAMDANHDGQVDADEAQTFAEEMYKQMQEHQRQAAPPQK